MIYVLIFLGSFLYSQCDDYNEFQCSSDNYCEWIENMESGSCGSLSGSNCELTPGCAWEWGCIEMGWWYNWCYTYGYECNGGTYSYDNGYCEEIMYELGDVNGDYFIDILDVIESINSILIGDYNSLADINNDNNMNILDVILLIELILNN